MKWNTPIDNVCKFRWAVSSHFTVTGKSYATLIQEFFVLPHEGAVKFLTWWYIVSHNRHFKILFQILYVGTLKLQNFSPRLYIKSTSLTCYILSLSIPCERVQMVENPKVNKALHHSLRLKTKLPWQKHIFPLLALGRSYIAWIQSLCLERVLFLP